MGGPNHAASNLRSATTATATVANIADGTGRDAARRAVQQQLRRGVGPGMQRIRH